MLYVVEVEDLLSGHHEVTPPMSRYAAQKYAQRMRGEFVQCAVTRLRS